MQSVQLFIPGDPKPMQRPRGGVNKKTGKTIFFIPQTTLHYQDKVKTAAMQPANLPELRRFLSSDSLSRLRIRIKLMFCRFRHPDPANVLTNIYDGLVRALGGNDKGYVGDLDYDVNSGLEEGYCEITITPYLNGKENVDEPII